MMLAIATLAAYLRTCAAAVSADTMRAIVAVESGGYSYAINDNTTRVTYCVPGGHNYPCSRKGATAIANATVGLGHSVDVGIAQINSSNFRIYGVTAAEMLEPCANLRVGSAILASAYSNSTTHFTHQRAALWHAIMAYNSGSLFAGEKYVRTVVDAALPLRQIQTVPSIAIILPATAVAGRSLGGRERSVKRPAGVGSPASPGAAPLLATGMAYQRGDLTDSLRPALSKQ